MLRLCFQGQTQQLDGTFAKSLPGEPLTPILDDPSFKGEPLSSLAPVRLLDLEGSWRVAQPEDQPLLQNLSQAIITPLTWLGQGSYGCVELCRVAIPGAPGSEAADLDCASVQQAAAGHSRPPTPGKKLSNPHLNTPSKHASLAISADLAPADVGYERDASCPKGAGHPANSHTTAAGGASAAGASPPRQGRLPFARLLIPQVCSPRGEEARHSSAPTSNTSSQQLDPELEPTQCDTPILPPRTSHTLASHIEHEHQHLPLLLSHSQQGRTQLQPHSQASFLDQPRPSPRPAPSPARSTSGARRSEHEGQGLLLTPRRQTPAAPLHSASSPCPTPGPSAFPISPSGHTPAKAPSPARQASAAPSLGRSQSSSRSLAAGSARQVGLKAPELVVAVKRVDFGDLLDLDAEQPAGQEAPEGAGRCSRARASGRNTAVRLSRMQAIELLQLSRCRDCPFIVRMFGRLEDDGRGQAAGGCGDSSSSLEPGAWAGARRRGVASCRIVMEWAEGGDLGSLIQALVTRREAASGAQAPAFQPKPPASSLRLLMSEAAARYYTACLLEALAFLHGRGLIHRDVKPSNLLIASDGRAKLADLGLACHVDIRRGAAGGAVGRAGTPRYMAPEVWSYGKTSKVRTYGIPADLFGVGCVLYELLLGRPPTDHPDDYLAKRPAWRLRTHHLPPCCSGPLRDLLYRLLHPKPRRRLQSCDEVRAHPWFAGFNWQGLRSGSLRAPYVPSDHRPPPVVAAGVGLPAEVSAPRGTPGRYGSAASLASASMELRRSPRPAPAVAGPSREASIGGLPPRPPVARPGISPYRRASGVAEGRVPGDNSGLCLKQAAAVAKLRRASPGRGGGAPLNGGAAATALPANARGVAGPLLGSLDAASGADGTSTPPSVASSLSAALASVLPVSLPWLHRGQQPPSPGPKQGSETQVGEAASEESLAMQERALSEPLCFKQERPSAFAARSHGFNSAAASCQSTLLASHDEDMGRLVKLGAAAAAAAGQPSGGSGGGPNSSTALPVNPVEALVAAGRRSVQGMWSMLNGTASQPECGQPEGVERDAGEDVSHSGTAQKGLQDAPSSASAPLVGGTLSYLLQLLPVRPSLSASQDGWPGDPQAQAAPTGVVLVSRVDGSGLHQARGGGSEEGGKGGGQGAEVAPGAATLPASHSKGPSHAALPSLAEAGAAPQPQLEPSIARAGGRTSEIGSACDQECTGSGNGRAGDPCADIGLPLQQTPPSPEVAPGGLSQCGVPRRVAHRPTDSYAFDDRHLEVLHRCPAWDSAASNSSSTAMHAAQPHSTAACSPAASKLLPPRFPSSRECTPGPGPAAAGLGGTGEHIPAARSAGGHGRSASSFSFDVPDALLCKDGSPAGFVTCSAPHPTAAKSPFSPAAGLVARAADRAAGGHQGRGSAQGWERGSRRGTAGSSSGGALGLVARCVASPVPHMRVQYQHLVVLLLAFVLAAALAAVYSA